MGGSQEKIQSADLPKNLLIVLIGSQGTGKSWLGNQLIEKLQNSTNQDRKFKETDRIDGIELEEKQLEQNAIQNYVDIIQHNAFGLNQISIIESVAIGTFIDMDQSSQAQGILKTIDKQRNEAKNFLVIYVWVGTYFSQFSGTVKTTFTSYEIHPRDVFIYLNHKERVKENVRKKIKETYDVYNKTLKISDDIHSLLSQIIEHIKKKPVNILCIVTEDQFNDIKDQVLRQTKNDGNCSKINFYRKEADKCTEFTTIIINPNSLKYNGGQDYDKAMQKIKELCNVANVYGIWEENVPKHTKQELANLGDKCLSYPLLEENARKIIKYNGIIQNNIIEDLKPHMESNKKQTSHVQTTYQEGLQQQKQQQYFQSDQYPDSPSQYDQRE